MIVEPKFVNVYTIYIYVCAYIEGNVAEMRPRWLQNLAK